MFKELKLKANHIGSLSWHGDALVDWVAGGRCYYLDGKVEEANVNYAYSFDSVVVSPSRTYTVLYTKNQTKGLVLRKGEVIREINRSFYQANVYDFPIVFSQLGTGQEVLIHCPNDYCQLDVEDIESGQILTAFVDRNTNDLFHSRLAVSPSGRWLLSAGWVWHPLDVVGLFDLSGSIADPTKLDKPMMEPPGLWEISSAAFLNDSYIFVSSSDEYLGDEGDPDDDQPGCYQIALWSIENNTYVSTISCQKPVGELMPLSEKHVVSFYEHPRLWDLVSGEMIHEWTEIDSGNQTSSITHGKKMPSIAIDAENRRFAVAGDKEVSVVVFE